MVFGLGSTTNLAPLDTSFAMIARPCLAVLCDCCQVDAAGVWASLVGGRPGSRAGPLMPYSFACLAATAGCASASKNMEMYCMAEAATDPWGHAANTQEEKLDSWADS